MEKHSENILKKIKKFIIEKNLIEKKDKVLIALSGGSDSVCMLDILTKLKDELDFTITAFHMNHNIRKEAINDENFVREICKKNNIDLFVSNIDIPKKHKNSSMSLEEIARQERYKAIEEIMINNNIDKAATAHHLLDNTESVILNMVRGSGINGLCGINYKNGNIIRPILILSKDEINNYIDENNLKYVTDITNFDTKYSRNNVRHNILPLLKNLNNNAFKHIYELSDISLEIVDLLKECSNVVKIKKEDLGISIDLKQFYDLHIAIKKQVILNMFISVGINKDVNSKTINKIIKLIEIENTSFDINTIKNYSFKRRYDRLYLVNKKKKEEVIDNNLNIKIEKLDNFRFDNNKFEIKLKVLDNVNKLEKNYKYVDISKIKMPLTIRYRKTGDMFSPLGLNGSKKLKKYFIDKKIEKEKRDDIPLLLDENGIISVLGYDISENYKADSKTKSILGIHIEYKKGE